MQPNFNQNYKGIRCRVCLVREGTSDEVIRINKPLDAYELVKEELVNSDREMLLSIMLTVRYDLIGVETVSIGSITASTTTPRAYQLKRNCKQELGQPAGVLLAWPAGDAAINVAQGAATSLAGAVRHR